VIAHTIEAALGCSALARTILSSEDAEILEVGRRAGCPVPFVRPADLADDRSSTVAVALHALDWLASHEGFTPDVVVLLPATAPLRRTEHIKGALDVLRGDGAAEAVVAVTEPDYSPYWMLTLSGGRLSWLFAEGRTVSRRQDLPAAYRPNGSIYAVRVPALREQRTFYPRATGAYVMPRDSSVNIDSEMELRLAEVLLARRSA
jgi:N-acylneuraminate cytidylyltransferase/CMP-N,N'-diacetyllegionaminic acid synthase